MLEGKVAVRQRLGGWGVGGGVNQRETRVESSTATLPSFGHSAYSRSNLQDSDTDSSFCYTKRTHYLLDPAMRTGLWRFDDVLFDPFS